MKANENRVLSQSEKDIIKSKLNASFTTIFEALGYDLDDQHIKGTPTRMAKMYVDEIFKGNFNAEPEFTTFENTKKLDEMVFVGPIEVKSTCAHHLITFHGSAYVAYIPDTKVCGVSKFARVVDWFARRPQIQEELTKQISDYLIDKLQTKNVAVYIEAQHLCMTMRGVEQVGARMKTSSMQGAFREVAVRKEFFDMVK